MLTDEQGQMLVQLARQTIKQELEGADGAVDESDVFADEAFQEHCGVFVTLHKREALRGCIGSVAAVEPIVDGVRRHAKNAAFHDPRFTPVSQDELAELDIEVSVLSQPVKLDYTDGSTLPALLKPGRDGVILKAASGAGATFLPQVWKQLPDPHSFLNHLCIKAGLQPTAWLTDPLEIQIYQVQHFEE